MDAAAFAATSRLDLSASNESGQEKSLNCAADFVVCSFYKIFGFPTSIGALLVQKNRKAKEMLMNQVKSCISILLFVLFILLFLIFFLIF